MDMYTLEGDVNLSTYFMEGDALKISGTKFAYWGLMKLTYPRL